MLDQFSPPMQRAVQVLIDGEWHDEEQVLLAMMRVIPPGQAMRRAESKRRGQRAAARARFESPHRQVQRDPETLRAMGARAIAGDLLRHSKRIERADRRVRIRPEALERLRRELSERQAAPAQLAAPG